MNFVELFLVAAGLSMDAFAVAICLGLTMKKVTVKKALTVGVYFGFFQALMPLIGFLAGRQFADKITAVDHWISFLLLGIIGGKMIKESFGRETISMDEVSLKKETMLPLAVATSIDALAAGISFAFLKIAIVPAVVFIGITTLTLSVAGVKIGNVFGAKYKSKSEFIGGMILIFMGLKILLEHLGILH